jgi:hypothetical protein
VWCTDRQRAAQDEGVGERQILCLAGDSGPVLDGRAKASASPAGHANCNLCGQFVESIHHLLLGCVYSREVWARNLLRSIELLNLCPASDAALAPWWLASRRSLSKERRRGFDSPVTLVWWNIWRERNNWVFNDAMKQAAELASWIGEGGGQWIEAGCSLLLALLQ